MNWKEDELVQDHILPAFPLMLPNCQPPEVSNEYFGSISGIRLPCGEEM